MTPPAATAAARAATPRAARRGGAGAGVRVAPRVPPRRWSGPAPAAAVAVPAPARAPARLRSFPPATRATPATAPLARLCDLYLLERLIRSRHWIAIVTVLLVGLVGTQLYVLQLNAGIGRSVARVTALQHDNAVLEADVSKLSSGDRIEASAQAMGMVIAPMGDIRFLTARRR